MCVCVRCVQCTRSKIYGKTHSCVRGVKLVVYLYPTARRFFPFSGRRTFWFYYTNIYIYVCISIDYLNIRHVRGVKKRKNRIYKRLGKYQNLTFLIMFGRQFRNVYTEYERFNRNYFRSNLRDANVHARLKSSMES